MDERDHSKRIVAGGFQCQMQLTQQRTLMVTGHVYSDDTLAEMNARIDAAQDALDRQYIRCDIVNKEGQIKAQQAGIEQFRDQLADLAARQAGAGTGLSEKRPKGHQLSSQERLALENGQRTIDQAEKNIAQLQAEIAAAQRKLGMTAA